MFTHVKRIKELLEVSLPVVSIIVVIANIWIVTKLAPIENRIASIESHVNAISDQHTFIMNNLVSKSEFNQVVTRIDKISGRVDEIIGILLKK